MSTSKLQRATSQFLSIYFGDHTVRENIRPEWLITSDGERLELDFFIDELSIAIEVQGKQHYHFIPFFHDNYEGFKQRLKWDRFKQQQCNNMRITLVEISSEDDLPQLYQFIPSREVQDGPLSIELEIKRAAQRKIHFYESEIENYMVHHEQSKKTIRLHKQQVNLMRKDKQIKELRDKLERFPSEKTRLKLERNIEQREHIARKIQKRKVVWGKERARQKYGIK